MGDIVGSPYEYNNHRSPAFALFHPQGRFTDDTICTGATMDWLNAAGNYAAVLQRWCRAYPSDYGGMFHTWLQAGSPVPYNSYGNGSAMRVGPVGCCLLYTSPSPRD